MIFCCGLKFRWRAREFTMWNSCVSGGKIDTRLCEKFCSHLHWCGLTWFCRSVWDENWIVSDCTNGQLKLVSLPLTNLLCTYFFVDISQDNPSFSRCLFVTDTSGFMVGCVIIFCICRNEIKKSAYAFPHSTFYSTHFPYWKVKTRRIIFPNGK